MNVVWVRIILGGAVGASLGWGMYRLVGCPTGGCPLTSNPWVSMIWWGLMGALLAGGMR